MAVMGNADRCVCCGDIIPEGRQVCPNCEVKYDPREFFSAEQSDKVRRCLALGRALSEGLCAGMSNCFDEEKNGLIKQGPVLAKSVTADMAAGFTVDMADALAADVKNYFENQKKRKVYCVTKILMHIAAEVDYFQRRIPDAKLSIQMTHDLYMLLAAAHQGIVSTPAGNTLFGVKIKEVRAPGLRYWISVYEESFTSQDYQEVWG